MTRYQTEKTVEAIKNIILPKFDNYLKEKRESTSIKKEIEKEIEKLEAVEDDLSNSSLNKYYDDKIPMTITINETEFYYDKKSDMFRTDEDIKLIAQNIVYRRHNLINYWRYSENISTRITAIVALLEETSFEDALTLVESQIDFEEFMENN